jgi:hypothetical protein
MLTVTVAGTLVPPGPEQAKVKVVAALSAPVLRVPLAARAPLQPPEAVQEVALIEDHVNVAASPEAIVVLEAWRVAVGNPVSGEESPPHDESIKNAPSAQISCNDGDRPVGPHEFASTMMILAHARSGGQSMVTLRSAQLHLAFTEPENPPPSEKPSFCHRAVTWCESAGGADQRYGKRCCRC